MQNLPTLEEIRQEKIRRRAERAKATARSELFAWCQYTDPTYEDAPHLRKLINALERVERGELRRVIFAMPPQHGKSTTASVKFPSWYLGRNPNRKVILGSYAAELAYDLSGKSRDELVEFGPPVFNIELAADTAAKSNWRLAGYKGGMVAAGVGGPMTGKGADLLLIDDPFKNAEEADSEAIRKSRLKWFRTTARTRLAPGGAIVLIQTRWHDSDLAGEMLRLAEAGGEKWETLVLPFFDFSKKAPQGLLWQKYAVDYGTLEKIAELKVSVGTRTFQCLYQGDPAPEEGEIFKRAWWRFWVHTEEQADRVEKRGELRPRVLPPSFDELIQSWDMAFKDLKDSDYVVGQLWGRQRADKFLLDQVRGQLSFTRTCEAVEKAATPPAAEKTGKWQAPWWRAKRKLVEDKANGPAVIDTLEQRVEGLVAREPDGGKEARAHAVTPTIESGHAYLPHPSLYPWVQDFIEEHARFPASANDDQVDAETQALRYLWRDSSYSPRKRGDGSALKQPL